MYKGLLIIFLLLTLQPLICMQNSPTRPRFTIVTPENIEEILDNKIFEVNNDELKKLVRKQKIAVFLIINPQECYLKVRKYGKTINTYPQIQKNSVTNIFQDE